MMSQIHCKQSIRIEKSGWFKHYFPGNLRRNILFKVCNYTSYQNLQKTSLPNPFAREKAGDKAGTVSVSADKAGTMHCMLMDLLHGFEVLSTTEETLFNSRNVSRLVQNIIILLSVNSLPCFIYHIIVLITISKVVFLPGKSGREIYVGIPGNFSIL